MSKRRHFRRPSTAARRPIGDQQVDRWPAKKNQSSICCAISSPPTKKTKRNKQMAIAGCDEDVSERPTGRRPFDTQPEASRRFLCKKRTKKRRRRRAQRHISPSSFFYLVLEILVRPTRFHECAVEINTNHRLVHFFMASVISPLTPCLFLLPFLFEKKNCCFYCYDLFFCLSTCLGNLPLQDANFFREIEYWW